MFYNVFSINTVPVNYATWTFLPKSVLLSNQDLFLKQQVQRSVNEKMSPFQQYDEAKYEKNGRFKQITEIKLQQSKIDEKQIIKIQKKSNLTYQRNEKDEQFLPNVKNYTKKRKFALNQNRNVIPNIMHQVMSFLLKKNRSGYLVQKLLKKIDIQKCSVKRFYTYQLLFKNKINHYVNVDSLLIANQIQEPSCEIYSKQQQESYIKICRILIQYFFIKQFDAINLTSNRMKSDKRIDHLKSKRSLLQKFKEKLRN